MPKGMKLPVLLNKFLYFWTCLLFDYFFFFIEATKDLLLDIVSKTLVNLIYDDLKYGIEKNF